MYLNIASLGTLCVLLVLKTPGPAGFPESDVIVDKTCSGNETQTVTPVLPTERVVFRFNEDNEFVWRLGPEEDDFSPRKETDNDHYELIIQTLNTTLTLPVKLEKPIANNGWYRRGTMPTLDSLTDEGDVIMSDHDMSNPGHGTISWVFMMSWLIQWILFTDAYFRRAYGAWDRMMPAAVNGKRRRKRRRRRNSQKVKPTRGLQHGDVAKTPHEPDARNVRTPNVNQTKTTDIPTDLDAVNHKRNRQKRRHRAQVKVSKYLTP